MRIVLLGFMVVAAACAPPPAAPLEEPPPDLPRHELVFARHSDAARTDYDIWRMCADGTQLASLVVEPGHQFQISVSPDGKEYVYSTKVNGAWDVMRRPFGPGEAVNLTRHPANDTSPAWSPDGKRIAFFSNRDAEKPELYLLDLETGAVERRTENVYHDSEPSWSPDGSRLVITRYFPAEEGTDGDGAGEIFEVDVAGRGERRLTELGGYNGGLAWSPDGERIAFHRTHESGTEIWLIEADGSNPRPITDTFVDEYSPEWSPDGNWIAFTAGVQHDGRGTFDIWLMRPDGTHRQVVNKAANTEAWHKWRPGEHYCR